MRYEHSGGIGRGVLYVDGDIDWFTIGEVLEAVDANLVFGDLVCDLSGVTFIDSAGVNALLRLGLSRRVTLRRPSRAVQHVLDILDQRLVTR